MKGNFFGINTMSDNDDELTTLRRNAVRDSELIAGLGKQLADAKENHARDVCATRRVMADYMGQVVGTDVTDSGCISHHACLLDDLAEIGRFRIVSSYGRMVVGYWPEHDPQRARPEI
jgi:hypothetical protein